MESQIDSPQALTLLEGGKKLGWELEEVHGPHGHLEEQQQTTMSSSSHTSVQIQSILLPITLAASHGTG